MKNIILAFSALCLLFVTSCKKKDVVLEDAQIPEPITAYVRAHFQNETVLNCLKDKKSVGYEYNVAITGDFLMRFDGSFSIEKIDGKTRLPESVVPVKIRDYVTANYAGQYVTDWEFEKKQHQIVELTNGVRLEFGESGQFIQVL